MLGRMRFAVVVYIKLDPWLVYRALIFPSFLFYEILLKRLWFPSGTTSRFGLDDPQKILSASSGWIFSRRLVRIGSIFHHSKSDFAVKLNVSIIILFFVT